MMQICNGFLIVGLDGDCGVKLSPHFNIDVASFRSS